MENPFAAKAPRLMMMCQSLSFLVALLVLFLRLIILFSLLTLPFANALAQRQDYKKHQMNPETMKARSATVDMLRRLHSRDPEAEKEIKKALEGGKESNRSGSQPNHRRIPLVAAPNERVGDTAPATSSGVTSKKNRERRRDLRRTLTQKRLRQGGGGKNKRGKDNDDGVAAEIRKGRMIALAGVIGSVVAFGLGMGLRDRK